MRLFKLWKKPSNNNMQTFGHTMYIELGYCKELSGDWNRNDAMSIVSENMWQYG